MPLSSCKPSSSSDRQKRADVSRNSFITPQRKHRKLLKDGSGSEVWPENIEKIFVDGLRQYWDSPWATYSRGRSRWRNQFLVDYLQKAGIDRSKKQVASHMQVLRNMWKGEPEYHLVAGGEELFLESGLLATVKAEDTSESGQPISPDGDAGCPPPRLSPSPPSPGFSPCEFKYESPSHSPSQLSSVMFDSYPTVPFSNESPRARSPSPSIHEVGNVALSSSPASRGSPPSTFTFEHRHVQHTASTPAVPLFNYSYPPLTAGPSSALSNSLPQLAKLEIPVHRTRFSDQVPSATRSSLFPSPTSSPTNKISSLCLWAEGMTPYNLSIDALRATSLRSLSPITIQIKLSLPSIDNVHSLPTLHGFHGSVTFNAPWPSSAKCITRVYAGKACISEEAEIIQLVASTANSCQMTGFLPTESSLSRSRWLDATLQTTITQEFTIDGDLMAHVFYDLERRACSSSPAAQLTGFTPHQRTDDIAAVTRPASIPFPYPTPTTFLPQTQFSRFWCRDQTSLSCGLAPVNGMPPVMATSMLY